MNQAELLSAGFVGFAVDSNECIDRISWTSNYSIELIKYDKIYNLNDFCKKFKGIKAENGELTEHELYVDEVA
jgi:hypothetical protein